MEGNFQNLISKGEIIDGYSVMRMIGKGGFGYIFEVWNSSGEKKAMKIEKLNIQRPALQHEVSLLRALQGSPYFPHFESSGRTNNFNFYIMEILGPSLSTARHVMPTKTFTPSTAIRISIEMLRCIKSLHEAGFIHRDIKPSNFLIRPSLSHPLALIDYGLSRNYIDLKTGELIKPRDHPGFVGTGKYASLNAHEGRELSRRDDLYSWFFSLIELYTGTLPWPSVSDKQALYEAKLNINMRDYCQNLPSPFFLIYRYIRKLHFKDAPHYDLIISFLTEALQTIGCSWNDPYDWRTLSDDELLKISAIPLTPPPNDAPIIPENLPEPILPEDYLSINSIDTLTNPTDPEDTILFNPNEDDFQSSDFKTGGAGLDAVDLKRSSFNKLDLIPPDTPGKALDEENDSPFAYNKQDKKQVESHSCDEEQNDKLNDDNSENDEGKGGCCYVL